MMHPTPTSLLWTVLAWTALYAPTPSPQDAPTHSRLAPRPGRALELEMLGAPLEGRPLAIRVRDMPPGCLGLIRVSATSSASVGIEGGRGEVAERTLASQAFRADARGSSPPLLVLARVTPDLVGSAFTVRAFALLAEGGGLASPPATLQVGGPPEGSLFPRPTYTLRGSTSLGQESALLADLNGDGLIDLAAAGSDGGVGTVAVRLQRRDGSFRTERLFTVGSGPDPLVSGDLDGDGDADLVAINEQSDDVTVLLGNGKGDFTAQPSVPTGDLPRSAELGDLNGDGVLDLAVGNYFGYSVTVLLGAGDGTFPVGVETPLDAKPAALRIVELDSRPGLDVVVRTMEPDGLVVLLNDGGGSFTTQRIVTLGNLPFQGSLISADFDGDGNADVAIGRDGASELRSFLGAGDGSFVEVASTPLPSRPQWIAAGSLNADGIPDLVVVSEVAGDAALLRGRGDGTFELIKTLYANNNVQWVGLDDLNRDGVSDAVVVSGSEVTLLVSQGDFLYDQTLDLSTQGSWSHSAAICDLDGDTLPDIAIADQDRGMTSLFWGLGRGRFAPESLLTTGQSPIDLWAGDLDGDGARDLVAPDLGTTSVRIHWGAGNRTFTPPSDQPVGNFPWALAVADLDGDGRRDLATCGTGPDSLVVLLASGPRAFAPPVAYPAGPVPQDIVSGRVDADAAVDLVTLNTDSDSVSVWLNLGDGTFGSPIGLPVHRSSARLALADLNQDGWSDLLVGGGNEVSVLLGQPGGFAPRVSYDPVGGSRAIGAADVDGDGNQDVVVGSKGPWGISVLRGRGDGTLEPPLHFTGEYGWGLAIGDLNGDLLPDVVSCWGDASVFPNRLLRGASLETR